jgi:hypothetical protein
MQQNTSPMMDAEPAHDYGVCLTKMRHWKSSAYVSLMYVIITMSCELTESRLGFLGFWFCKGEFVHMFERHTIIICVLKHGGNAPHIVNHDISLLCFICRARTSSILRIGGCVGPRACLDMAVKNIIPISAENRTQSIQPMASYFTDGYAVFSLDLGENKLFLQYKTLVF